MSDAFHSARFGKNVWLTNHAIESVMVNWKERDQP